MGGSPPLPPDAPPPDPEVPGLTLTCSPSLAVSKSSSDAGSSPVPVAWVPRSVSFWSGLRLPLLLAARALDPAPLEVEGVGKPGGAAAAAAAAAAAWAFFCSVALLLYSALRRSLIA